MIDPPSSPGDPLFYLHHTWLDKLWWKWQALDLENRLTDMSGNNVMSASDFAMFQPPPPEDWPYVFRLFGC
jgi:tyrosinase